MNHETSSTKFKCILDTKASRDGDEKVLNKSVQDGTESCGHRATEAKEKKLIGSLKAQHITNRKDNTRLPTTFIINKRCCIPRKH